MNKLSVQIKSFLKSDKKSSGFTLIELLVVIGILGILAAALIATIDPFEQLKKAQDANVKNTAVEFVDANVRYYVTHNALPWAVTTNTECDSLFTSSPVGTFSLDPASAAPKNCLDALISDGELKEGFTTVADTLKKIIVSSGGKDGTNNIVACFQPQSKAEAQDVNCKYNSTGVVDSTVTHDPSNTTNLCYWCAE